MRVFIVGHTHYPAVTRFYKEAIGSLGCQVDMVSLSLGPWQKRLLGASRKASLSLYEQIEVYVVGSRLRNVPNDKRHYDLAIVFKGTGVPCQWVDKLQRRGTVVFHYFTDDYFHPNFTSQTAIEAIPEYDCIFTPLRVNIPELYARRARRAEYLPFGYDPEIHHPVQVDDPMPSEAVTFVGTRRPDRVEVLTHLVRSIPGLNLKIWGYGWKRLPKKSPLAPYVGGKYLGAEEMTRVLSGSAIALGFVVYFGPSRTMHPMRTFEIPACGTFLLAERANGEFLEFFEEGSEIATWGKPDELVEKVKYFLEYDTIRRQMAKRAFERVHREGHSYKDRAQRVLALYKQFVC